MQAKLVHITTVYSNVEAQLIKSKLESEAIHCFLFNENFSNLESGLSFAGTKIMVYDYKLIEAFDILELEKNFIHCPSCYSLKILDNFDKNIIDNFLQLFRLKSRKIQNIKSNYKCSDCGNEF